MKKLENLNKEKFLLEPQKMGELVGGAKIVEQSGAGRFRVKPDKDWIDYSSDTITYNSQSEKDHGYMSGFSYVVDTVSSQPANPSNQAG